MKTIRIYRNAQPTGAPWSLTTPTRSALPAKMAERRFWQLRCRLQPQRHGAVCNRIRLGLISIVHRHLINSYFK